jgi:cyclohexadieny/prephenate dehydrogenase
LRRDSPGTRIVACARRAETLKTVRRLELADETTDDPAAAASGADLVVIATPLSAYAEIGRRIGPALKEGAILTDVGSVNQAVIRDLGPMCRRGSTLFRAIRLPGSSPPDPSPVSPSSLPAAGAS